MSTPLDDVLENRARCAVLHGDCMDLIGNIPDEFVQCVVTSPPYYSLRQYFVNHRVWGGDPLCNHVFVEIDASKRANTSLTKVSPGERCTKCNAWRGTMGNEPSPQMYIDNMVELFREVRRVLRPDGTMFLNIGDSYASRKVPEWGLKPKDQLGIPHRMYHALQADGWVGRMDSVWCLAGSTPLYALVDGVPIVHNPKDLYRKGTVDRHGVFLPSPDGGWVGVNRIEFMGKMPVKTIELCSGVKVTSSYGHKWPTQRGLVTTENLKVGDVIDSADRFSCNFDWSEFANFDVGRFIGLYIAEGSFSNKKIHLSLHAKEIEIKDFLRGFSSRFGGSCHTFVNGNMLHVNLCGSVLRGIIAQFVSGKGAKGKHLTKSVWKEDHEFIRGIMTGYLEGDGHWDKKNNRWRLGLTRNRKLETDLRLMCDILGWSMRLKDGYAYCNGVRYKCMRGEVREIVSDHHNVKQNNEIIKINKRSSPQNVYAISVDSDDELFALPGGVVTHNSKPNPGPQSTKDRPINSHEYVFMLTKSPRYFYDYDAVMEDSTSVYKGAPKKRSRRSVWTIPVVGFNGRELLTDIVGPDGTALERDDNCPLHGNDPVEWYEPGNIFEPLNQGDPPECTCSPVTSEHFAVMPPRLVEPCILAGTSVSCCSKCRTPYSRRVEVFTPKREKQKSEKDIRGLTRTAAGLREMSKVGLSTRETLGWDPACDCNADPTGCIVFDPFNGVGTTGLVALRNDRRYIGTELNLDYVRLTERRLIAAQSEGEF